MLTNKCRLWIPAFVHLVVYLNFIRHGRDNIDIIPAMCLEEVWITLTLILVAIPCLMRLAKRFTTTGVALGTVYGSSRSGSKTKEFSHPLTSFNKNESAAKRSRGDSLGENIVLRPGQGLNSISIDAAREKGEAASVGSTAESHIGILRKIDFEISSETK